MYTRYILSCCLILGTLFAVAQDTHDLVPQPPENTRWIINDDYTDEFNGDALDLVKWYDYHPRWLGRTPAIFLPRTISLVDGNMQIKNEQLAQDTVVTLTNGTQLTYSIGGGAVVSRKTTAHYGYYEVNMRASRVQMSSTFWFSNPPTGTECDARHHNELDVVETIGKSTRFPGFATNMKSNTHFWEHTCDRGVTSPSSIAGETPLGGNSADRFHRYGVWWKNATEIDFYLDGVQTHSVRRPADKPMDREMHLNMVTETYDFQPPPSPAELADDDNNTTYYDYVRGFRLVGIDDTIDLGGNPTGNLVANGGFETGDLTDWGGWGGNPREVVANDSAAGEYVVRIVGGGAPEQTIDVEPNTDYILSCRAKVITGQVALGVKPTNSNDALGNLVITGSGFGDYEVPFNSGDLSQVKIFFFAMAGGNEALGDEFSVVRADGGGVVEPEPANYEQFSRQVEFLDFPQITTASTQIPARFLYQTARDQNIDLVLRTADGTELAREEYAAKAGYGHRREDFTIGSALTDGAEYTLDAEMTDPAAPDDVVSVGRLRFTVGGMTTSTFDRTLPRATVSPNPTRDELLVSDLRGNNRYRIFDLTGREVLTGQLNNSGSRIDVRHLPAGVFLLSVEGFAPTRFTKM